MVMKTSLKVLATMIPMKIPMKIRKLMKTTLKVLATMIPMKIPMKIRNIDWDGSTFANHCSTHKQRNADKHSFLSNSNNQWGNFITLII